MGGPTAVAAGEEDSSPEEGAQVAEAEREEEEEEDGDGAAGGSGGQETGDGDSASPGFGVGGVVPDLWLTSKTKGRFASQVGGGEERTWGEASVETVSCVFVFVSMCRFGAVRARSVLSVLSVLVFPWCSVPPSPRARAAFTLVTPTW